MSIPKAKITIHDVAREAQVSAKTVSRVVNEEPGVGAGTRNRIQHLIRELGYQPHMGARSMRSPRQDAIGVTVPMPLDVVPMSQPHLSWFFAELYRVFGVRGEIITFDMNPFKAGTLQSDYARALWQNRVSGLIINGPLAVDDTVIRRVHESGRPYLSFGRLDSLPECSSAVVDYEEAAYLSTKFLIDRGHRHIALLKGFEGCHPGVERLRGYRRALEEAGIAYRPEHVAITSFGARQLVDTAYRVIVRPEVTALIDSSGAEDGPSLREAAMRAGRTLGSQVELVAWSYTYGASILEEAEAHVWLPAREACREGLELFAQWFDGKRSEPIAVVYRPTLYRAMAEGESTAPRHIFDLRR